MCLQLDADQINSRTARLPALAYAEHNARQANSPSGAVALLRNCGEYTIRFHPGRECIGHAQVPVEVLLNGVREP